MSQHTHPPKFRKGFVSWKGRAAAMKTYLESTGHNVDYSEDWAAVSLDGQIKNAPKHWWEAWKWW